MLKLIGGLQQESCYWSFTYKRVDNYVIGSMTPETDSPPENKWIILPDAETDW